MKRQDERKIESVGTLNNEARELADMMQRRKVNILCVQVTPWKGSKVRLIGTELELYYSGTECWQTGNECSEYTKEGRTSKGDI